MKKYLPGIMLTTLCLVLSASALLSQTAQFTVTAAEGNFCAPAKITFNPAFSEKPEYFYWNFGLNDEESDAPAPTVTYVAPGVYRVKLTVVFKTVVREVLNNVTIQGSAGLVIQPQKEFLCKPGDNVFTLKTTDSLSKITWKTSSGNVVVNNQNVPVRFSFADFGTYGITVDVEDRWGCKSTVTDSFRVEKLKARLNDSLSGSCLPANARFSAEVMLPAGSSVTRYTWNFDDGSAQATTSVNSVTHTYTAVDSFVTTVSVLTSEGCENTFLFAPVAIGSPPVITGLNFSEDTICASETLFITATASGANLFLFEISDGSFSESANGRLSHKFKSLGTFTVKVTPVYNGCSGAPKSFSVLVRGVIANFALTNSCAQKNRFTFRNTSTGTVNSIQWNFEGSAAPVTISNPEFTFPEQGKFAVGLIVRNNASGCADTADGFVYTAKPKLEPADTFVCLGSSVSMKVNDFYTHPRTVYNWNLAGKTVNNSTLPSISLNADAEGLFTNRVIISNGTGYCRDTLVQPMAMRVAGLSPVFETIAANCTNENIVIKNNTSSIYGITPGVTWNWDFGNGATSALRDPAPAVYTTPGSYRISLLVSDSKGCTDSLKKTIRIRRTPPLKVSPEQQKVCQGQEVELTAFHTAGVTWSPAGLVNCDTCSMVKVKPMAPTNYIALTRDSFNCTAVDTVKLDVWYPFEWEGNLLRDTAVCYGSSVQYDLKTTGKIVFWSPASGLSATNIPNPVAKPETTTTYIATVTDSVRCFVRTDTAVLTVYPLPKAEHDTLLIVPFDGDFTIKPVYSNDIVNYRWRTNYPLSCLDCPNPSGKATDAALFELDVVSDKGCTASVAINLVIDCSSKNIYMPTAFSPDKNGLNEYYYPITRGVRRVKRFAVFNRFGQIIFERKDFVPNISNEGWDGTFKGQPQPSGIYTYWVELLCGSGNLQQYKGSFFLYK